MAAASVVVTEVVAEVSLAVVNCSLASTTELISLIKKCKEHVARFQASVERDEEKLSSVTRKLKEFNTGEEERRKLEEKKSELEKTIREYKSNIAAIEDAIVGLERSLATRGESFKAHTPTMYSNKVKSKVSKLMDKSISRKESLSIVSGGGGVGKSTFIAMMLEMEPPLLRVSTPCAKMPLYTAQNRQIAKLHTPSDEHKPMFVALSDEKYTKMMLKSGKLSTTSSPWTKKLYSSVMKVVYPQKNTLSEADKEFCRILYFGDDSDLDSLDYKVLGRIVDVGGQPQLLELLPRFITRLSHGIVVIDLSQDLTDYPVVYFYGEDGKPVGEGFRSNLTNEHLFRLFLQMIVSQSSSNKTIRVIIVGTHRDVESQSTESRENKEDKLQEIIASFKLGENIIYTDETCSRVIFAVNAKTPSDEDHAVSRKLMEIIMNEEEAESISIPLNYHKLEATLKEMTHTKRIALSFVDVFEHIFRDYTRTEFKDGLIFLSNAFRIFYFKEFPDLIFGDPQLLLNLLTEITVCHIKLTTNPGKEGVSAIWKSFKEKAIITESILKQISNVYDDILTPSCMFEVLELLLIVFKVNPGKYLMPSLLTATVALPSLSSSSISMLLYFPLGLARFGVYCSTVCKLASSSEWKWSSRSSVHRNSFQFELPNGRGIVTLNDSFDSFFQLILDIHPNLPIKKSSICRETRAVLTKVINEVTHDLRYTPDPPELGFLCSYQHDLPMAPHPARLIKDGGYLNCTKDTTIVIGEISDNQMLWLQDDETPPVILNATRNVPQQNLKPTGNLHNAPSTCEPVVIKKQSVLSDEESVQQCCYQHFVDMIPQEKQAKLQKQLESDQHMRILAEKMTGWEAKYDLFHLDEHIVSDIKDGRNRDKPTLQRIEVLHIWKNKSSPDNTYDSLLHIFTDGGFIDCAKNMVAILREDS